MRPAAAPCSWALSGCGVPCTAAQSSADVSVGTPKLRLQHHCALLPEPDAAASMSRPIARAAARRPTRRTGVPRPALRPPARLSPAPLQLLNTRLPLSVDAAPVFVWQIHTLQALRTAAVLRHHPSLPRSTAPALAHAADACTACAAAFQPSSRPGTPGHIGFTSHFTLRTHRMSKLVLMLSF